MCKFGELRLTPEEARELRAATERLIRHGLAWFPDSPGDASEAGQVRPDGSTAPDSFSLQQDDEA